jgi:hypothetical protein
MSRTKQPEPHFRYEYNELHRFDSLLKHAATGLQFVQQALDGLREVVGTGVLYTEVGLRGRRARPKRITSAKAMLTLRERQAEAQKAATGETKARKRKPHQRARRRGRKAQVK